MRRALLAAGLMLALPAAAKKAPATNPPAPPKTMMWLYGSSEAAALERATFRAMVRYAVSTRLARSWNQPFESAVLADGASLDAPKWQACTPDQPDAVVFDIDETLLLNTGWNYDAAQRGDPAFDADRWALWEETGLGAAEPVPGAKEAVDALRAHGIAVVFISNRDRAYKGKDLVDQTVQALAQAGLGVAVPGKTLFLNGDVAPGSGKDPRRAEVAKSYCVLAMMGDQFGDFSDAFNAPKKDDLNNPGKKKADVAARRALADTAAVYARLGQGWFLLPNPVYGPGVGGDYGDLFSPDLVWPKGKK